MVRFKSLKSAVFITKVFFKLYKEAISCQCVPFYASTYLNTKYLNNRDIWYCENAICDKKALII